MNGIELEKLLVRDVMSTSAVTATRGETLSEVISKMKKKHLREVPVLDGDKPVGLVGYASFLQRRSLPLGAKAEQVMLPCPRLEEDMLLTSAVEEMMSAGVRGAPVVRAGRMVGFLSRTDVIKVLPRIKELKDKEVSQFMTRNPQAVTERESVRKAEIMMKSLREKTLPVVDADNRLIGAIGMPEVIEVFWSPKSTARPPNEVIGDRAPAEISVGSIMSKPAVYISPSHTIGHVSSLMIDRSLATVFVEENGELVGVVSQADLMEQILSLKPREGVYVQLTGLDQEDPDVYDVLYDLIGKSMKRIDKIESPKVLTIHVSSYHQEGMRSKYSLSARLTTKRGMHYAKANDWDLYKTMDSLLNSLEKNFKKEHDRLLDKRKSKPFL